MSDAKASAARADDSARDVDTSDEQLWNELSEEDEGKDGEPDARDGSDWDDADGKDEPPPDPDDEQAPEPSGDEASGERGNAGDTDGLDPAALQAQIDRLQRALNSEKGRTAKSRNEIDRLKSEISAARHAQRDMKDDDLLKQEREKVEASREEYPEVVGALVDTVHRLEGRLDQLSKREQRELEAAQGRLNEALDEQWGVFTTEHPDGLSTIAENREAFDRWLEDQPKALRDIYAANEQDVVDGTQAAYLVSQFKAALLDADGGAAPDHDRLQARRQRQLAGARSTRTPGRQQASSAPPRDADDPALHWNYWEQQERRRAK